ncbi:MAG: DUF393 domain-containing protein [Deltaproteobacteria bacterium]|nr:DUF393 domain-containing protein [Deltaproteobacteria bacterium]
MIRTTEPPARATLIYDGECVFCRASKDRLHALLRDDGVEYASFRDPAVLARFPGLTEDDCDQAMQFVATDGRIFSGAEAAARALVRRPWFAFGWLYYLPGVRQGADYAYRHIARRRFGISGRSSECNDEVCALPPPRGA